MATYVIDLESLADADGDEGLRAEALHGEGHAARRDVADRTERLEDPHPLSLFCLVVEPPPAAGLRPLLSPLVFLGFNNRAPSARVLVRVWQAERRRQAGVGGARFPGRSVWLGLGMWTCGEVGLVSGGSCRTGSGRAQTCFYFQFSVFFPMTLFISLHLHVYGVPLL
jgi:hypothetical protein